MWARAELQNAFVSAMNLRSNAHCRIWLFLVAGLYVTVEMFECDRRLFRLSSVFCIQDIRMSLLKAFKYGSRWIKCGSVFDGRNVRND